MSTPTHINFGNRKKYIDPKSVDLLQKKTRLVCSNFCRFSLYPKNFTKKNKPYNFWLMSNTNYCIHWLSRNCWPQPCFPTAKDESLEPMKPSLLGNFTLVLRSVLNELNHSGIMKYGIKDFLIYIHMVVLWAKLEQNLFFSLLGPMGTFVKFEWSLT